MKRFHKILCLWIFVSLIFIISGPLVFNFHQRTKLSPQRSKTTMKTLDFISVSQTPVKHVTKSLSELGKMDEINSHVLFLNHIPNCGGEILVLLLQRLQGYNNYKHVRLKSGDRKLLKPIEQEDLVDEVYGKMRQQAVPLSFDKQIYFVNFSAFDRQFPTYLNLIRDPGDKIISRSTFSNERRRRNRLIMCLQGENKTCSIQDSKLYDLAIPYFCGHEPQCLIVNDEWAFQKAKSNIERYYPVVGVLESLNTTFEVLEAKIPNFFRGIHLHASQLQRSFDESKKRYVSGSETLKDKVRRMLHKEFEFYQWVHSRLFKQKQSLVDPA